MIKAAVFTTWALTAILPSRLLGDETPLGDVVRTELGERLDTHFSRLSIMGFSGCLLVAVDSEIILARGYGFADRGAKRPFTPQTMFSTGSITKPFTGIAIARLYELGEIDFHQTLGDFFERVPPEKRDITVHQLLTHSSGFPGAIGHDFSACARDEYVKLAMKTELRFDPGTQYHYSNVGFSLLAAILEEITGSTYNEFLAEHILEPAGMERTSYRLFDFDAEDFSHGYKGDEHWGLFRDQYWTEEGPSWHLVGNGALHSSLHDMYLFHQALLDDTLLTSSTKDIVFEGHVSEGGPFRYGYGWSIYTSPEGERVIQHNGGNPYVSSDFKRYVDRDMVYYIHSNDGLWRAPQISRHVDALLRGQDLPLPPPVTSLDTDALAPFAGLYALESGATIRVGTSSNGLTLDTDGPDAYALTLGLSVDAEKARHACDFIQGELDRVLEHGIPGRKQGQPSRNALVAELDHLRRRLGPFRSARILGALPVDRSDPDLSHLPAEAMWVRLHASFEMSDEMFAVILLGDNILGIDDMAFPVRFDAWPLEGGGFAFYDLPGSSSSRFSIRTQDGVPSELIFETDRGPVAAKRVEPQ